MIGVWKRFSWTSRVTVFLKAKEVRNIWILPKDNVQKAATGPPYIMAILSPYSMLSYRNKQQSFDPALQKIKKQSTE